MIKGLIHRLITAGLPIAQAHCDTADGPAASDGRRALETGEVAYALKWIPATSERELRDVFAQVMAVRPLSPQAAEIADRLFLETLVRLHRLSEGVGFTGIQPAGVRMDPVVAAADRALDTGELAPVLQCVAEERRDELQRRFKIARSKQDFRVEDIDAGRDFISAYVDFFKYAEGHEAHGYGAHDSGAQLHAHA